MSLLISGCGREKITRGEYLDIRYDMIDMGKSECDSHGMEYAATEVLDFGSGKVICYTSSPFKLYNYKIGET